MDIFIYRRNSSSLDVDREKMRSTETVLSLSASLSFFPPSQFFIFLFGGPDAVWFENGKPHFQNSFFNALFVAQIIIKKRR